MYYNTISQRYQRAFDIIKTLPMTLLGVTALMLVLSVYTLRSVVMWIFPLAAIPVTYLLSVGMMGVFLKATRGEEYGIMDFFAVFKDWQTIKRIVCGMLWMLLMVYLWSVIPALAVTIILLIPTFIVSLAFDTEAFFILYGIFIAIVWIVAGVMAIIKSMEYSLTGFILIDRPDIKATDAVKESSRLTKGIRGRIFGARILPSFVLYFVVSIVAAFSELPLIGWLFGAAAIVVNILLSVCVSVFTGLVMAGFYADAVNPPPPPPPPVYGYQQYYGPQNNPYYQQPAPPQNPQPAPQPAPAPAPEPPAEPLPEEQNPAEE